MKSYISLIGIVFVSGVRALANSHARSFAVHRTHAPSLFIIDPRLGVVLEFCTEPQWLAQVIERVSLFKHWNSRSLSVLSDFEYSLYENKK